MHEPANRHRVSLQVPPQSAPVERSAAGAARQGEQEGVHASTLFGPNPYYDLIRPWRPSYVPTGGFVPPGRTMTTP